MTNYAVVSLLVSIGMQLLTRCGNDFEAARQASIMSDIKLMIPPEVSEDIAEMKAVVRRMLATNYRRCGSRLYMLSRSDRADEKRQL